MSHGDVTLSLPGLQPVAFFGLRTNVKGNAYFLTDHDILYPAGSVLVIHNHIQKHQKYIKLVDQQHGKEALTKEQHIIKEIVLSPSRCVCLK